MENFKKYLERTIPEKDSLKIVKKEAESYFKAHSTVETERLVKIWYQWRN